MKNTEFEKCKKSPYYYATKFLRIDGKPFTTRLNEEEFNRQFREINGENSNYLKNVSKLRKHYK